jgi:putative flippase GtrA
MSWNALLLFVLVTLGTFDLYAKAIATAVVLFWNFTMQKMWTFRE